MKQFKPVIIAAFVLCCALPPAPARAATRLKPNGLSFEAGKIHEKDGRSDLYFASLIPQFSFGRITAILNINYTADSKHKIRDGGEDFLVLDTLNYRNGDKVTLRYSEIKELTLGDGLIVTNYRSDILGNVPLNRQRGVELDLISADSSFTAFGTQSGLSGGRAVIGLGDIQFGVTGVNDSDPNFTEVGLDISTNFNSEKVRVYADGAKILKHGDGLALGVTAKPLKAYSVTAELRNFNSDFLPGLVDEHYEAASPFSKIRAAHRTYGMYNAISFNPNPETSLALTYERYKSRRPRTTVKARGRIGSRINADVFYAQENNIPKGGWSNPNNSIARAIFTFKINRKLDIIADYYRAYDETLKKQDSLTFKARLNLF